MANTDRRGLAPRRRSAVVCDATVARHGIAVLELGMGDRLQVERFVARAESVARRNDPEIQIDWVQRHQEAVVLVVGNRQIAVGALMRLLPGYRSQLEYRPTVRWVGTFPQPCRRCKSLRLDCRVCGPQGSTGQAPR